MAPPAGWFLRTPAVGRPAEASGRVAVADPATGMTDGPGTDDDSLAGEWFEASALEPGETPISWYQDPGDPETELPAPAAEPPAPPAAASPAAEPPAPPAAEAPEAPAAPAAEPPAAPGPRPSSPRLPNPQPGTTLPGDLSAEPVVGATRALRGRAGGPGFQPGRPGAAPRRAPADASPWQTSHRLWRESEIQWQRRSAPSPHPPQTAHPPQNTYPPQAAHQPAPERIPDSERPTLPYYYPPQPARSPYEYPPQPARPPYEYPPPPARPPHPVPPPRPAPPQPARSQQAPLLRQRPPMGRPTRSGTLPPEPVGAVRDAWPEPEPMQVPLGAPVFAEPDLDARAGPDRADSGLDIEPDEDSWRPLGHPAPLWNRAYDDISYGGPVTGRDTLLLEPERPGLRRPNPRRRLVRRRTATIAVPVVVLVAVAVLALALLTGHGPKFGQLTANQQGSQQPDRGTSAQSPLTIGMYPGQQQRGVFQAIGRIVASGNTIVAIGSQVSDGVTRQQFFVSANGGASWRLAPVRVPGGGQPPLGYVAARVAGGPGGWLAEGPQALWTSPDGLTWTLAATHGITPQLNHDGIWVLTKTAEGFLAAGQGAAPGGGHQAVIWTSRDGLSWQRMTAAQLGLAGPGETVQSIYFATWRGTDTLISGTVARDGTTYSAVWRSTDGGSAWTRVTVPADHGAGDPIVGLASDASGLIAVRSGRSASGTVDGVSYFSPNGADWQYSATIGAASGWSPTLVKGSDDGFVVAGTGAAGQIVAYVSALTGTNWSATGSLGAAAGESVVGATVGAAGTIVAVGSVDGSRVSQQPVFLEANTAGQVRPIPLASIPGAVVPELAVNGLAVAGEQQIAVGSADGYPAVWRKASGGSWALVSSLSQVPAGSGLTALTGVTHGSAGWLAVGTPGPVVLTSPDGTNWRSDAGPGSITDDLTGVEAVAATAGPVGYVIVGKLVAPNGACVADVWWSPNLTFWTRAFDVNDASGSSQVVAVAADAHGFVSVGSHNGKPAVWTTTNGRSWTTIVLPLPNWAPSAVLQQIAISGNRVAALGQEIMPAGTLPFAELSVDGGTTWHQVPFRSPGPDTEFTALTAGPGGFTATGEFGPPGQRQIAVWTSANGTVWAPSRVTGLTGAQAGGSYQITALAASRSAVTGIGLITTQQAQEVFTVSLPSH